MEKADFDRFAAEYASMHETSLGAFRGERDYFAEYKINDVATEVTERGRVAQTRRMLDFGAGCGNSIPYFRKFLPRADRTCPDVPEESLDIGRREYPGQARFVSSDGGAISAEANTFVLAFSACVFDHIDIDHAEQQRTCRSCAACSATKGCCSSSNIIL